uniref:Uncharacterized protein n=1 Tax=Amphimedon queenslandica TaxID=400682 RepID=A0A1X7V583_AMPQE
IACDGTDSDREPFGSGNPPLGFKYLSRAIFSAHGGTYLLVTRTTLLCEILRFNVIGNELLDKERNVTLEVAPVSSFT